MRLAPAMMSTLSTAQVRMVVAATAAAALAQTLGASFNYVLVDMLRDLGSSAAHSDFARQMPAIGALLVTFVAGAVGQRLGFKRVLVTSCALYSVGCAAVAVAPGMPVAIAGLLVADIGKAALLVVALAALSTRVRREDGRATAFAVFSAAIPFAYLFVPPLAAVVVESAGWRWVAVVWIAAGILALILVAALMPADREGAEPTGEMLTPALAGVVLAAAVEAITQLSQQGVGLPFLLAMALCVGAAGALTLAMRTRSNPTLDLTPLRHGNMVLLLAVLVLTLFANLFFYMTMALQYIYDLPPIAVALAMAPAQLSAVVGAIAAGGVVRRWGITRAGSVLMAVVAISLLSSAALGVDSPLWLAMVIVCVYAGAAAGGGMAVTNAVMDCAPPGKDGAAAAFRGAAASIGAAIGVAGMTAVVTAAASASLHHQFSQADRDPATSTQVASGMLADATSEDSSSLYAVPVAETADIDDFRRQAYLEGFRAHGLVGGAVTLAAAGMFYAVRRRLERQDSEL